jgi:anti-sigma factor RsiW
MNCEEVRTHLRDFVKDRLDPALRGGVGAHLGRCASCSSAERAEHALDELLEQRLPRFAAPTTLQRRLGLLVGRPEPARPAPRRWRQALAPAMAAALALGLGGLLLQQRGARRGGEVADLTSELVNDHLRVLASQHPVEIESGGGHQVKPWFEGRLDFAPIVPVPEGDAFTLRGGSIGYVFDRKAAVLVYGLRLHVVTLLVFRADGLDWAGAADLQRGPPQLSERSARGFNVALWRSGGLGYALVSDVNPAELGEIAARLAAVTAQPRGP